MITKYLCVLALFSLTMYTYSKRMVKNLRGQCVCVCVQLFYHAAIIAQW